MRDAGRSPAFLFLGLGPKQVAGKRSKKEKRKDGGVKPPLHRNRTLAVGDDAAAKADGGGAGVRINDHFDAVVKAAEFDNMRVWRA